MVVWWLWLIVVVAVGWDFVSFWVLTVGVVYFDDSSLHEQMVRFVMNVIRCFGVFVAHELVLVSR